MGTNQFPLNVWMTGKRISCKLLRNCVQFLAIIHDVLKDPHMEFLRHAREVVEIKGTEGKYDIRKLNSYPSKVGIYVCVCVCVCACACVCAH